MALTDSLVAYWTLDEPGGTRADSVGANHLSDNNTVTQAAGSMGSAAQFTALNLESLTLSDNADVSMGDIDCTFAVWAYFDSLLVERPLISKYATLGAREYALFYHPLTGGVDSLKFLVSNDGAMESLVHASTFGTPSTGTWIFVVAWHDASANTINIQVNDGPVDSAAHATGIFRQPISKWARK